MADEPLKTAVLTDVGIAKLDAAYQAGTKITIAEMALGDSNLEYVVPDPAFTQLVNEFGRQPINEGNTSDTWINAIVYVDSQQFAGHSILEFGLYDDEGDLIVYSSYTPSVVPSVRQDYIQLEIECSVDLYNASAVTIEVTPIYPQATELERGIAKIATDEDVAAGVDDEKIVTTKKLKNQTIIQFIGMHRHSTFVGPKPDENFWIPDAGVMLNRADYPAAFAIISKLNNYVSESTRAADAKKYAGYWGSGDGSTTFSAPNIALLMHIKSAGAAGNVAGESKLDHVEDHAHITGFTADAGIGQQAQSIGRISERALTSDGDCINNYMSTQIDTVNQDKYRVRGTGSANGITTAYEQEPDEELTITGSHVRPNAYASVVNSYTDTMGVFYNGYIFLPKGEF